MSKPNDLDPIVAFIGANDGANKGFWRVQPRDRSGRWIIMGAAVKAMFRDLKNDLKSIVGRYVGPTGRPGEARMLVKGEQNIPDGVYTVDSHNLETFKAKLPESFLEEKGLPLEYEDIKGNKRSISKANVPSLEEFEATRQDITPNDERLAKGELTDEEKEAEQAGREESPLAELPGGFESLNKDEAREMLRESGIDPDEFDPDIDDVPEDDFDAERIYDVNPLDIVDNPRISPDENKDTSSDNDDLAADLDLFYNQTSLESALGRDLTDEEIDAVGFLDRDVPNNSEEIKTNLKNELREKGFDDSFEPDTVNSVPEKSPEESFVEEALFYGGPTKDLDDFIKDQDAKELRYPQEMNPGDVFQLTGGQLVTVESVSPGKDRNGLKTFDLVVVTDDGTRGKLNLRASQELDYMPNRKGNLPTPDATPDETPEVPEKPAPKPKETKPKKPPYPERASMDTFLDRARKEGREDDGGNIAPSEKTNEELRNTKVRPIIDPATGKPLKIQVGEDKQGRPKYKTVENPDAIMQQLLNDYPEAKINERGEIIVERNKFIDSDGTEYEYEIAVAKTYGNGFLEKYKFTNVETGEEQEFYHYDYKDSYASLHGKKNGIKTFRDQILGQAIPGGELTKEKARYFGPGSTLDKRIKFFRGKANKANLNNPNMKLLTQEELVKKFLEGRAQKLNLSINPSTGLPLLTQLQEELPSFWEAVDSGDKQARIARIISVLGRLPDNQLARAEMIKILRSEVSDRYNGTGIGRKMATFANNLERVIKNGRFDINNLGRIPYSAKDGNTRIEPGMRVRYTNNEGDESVGIVSALNPNTGVNEYHDTVRVKFADGTEVNILATKYMDVVDNDTPLSNYTGRIEGDELVERRAERYNIDLASYNDIFDPDEGEDGPSDNPGPDGPEPDDLPPTGGFGEKPDLDKTIRVSLPPSWLSDVTSERAVHESIGDLEPVWQRIYDNLENRNSRGSLVLDLNAKELKDLIEDAGYYTQGHYDPDIEAVYKRFLNKARNSLDKLNNDDNDDERPSGEEFTASIKPGRVTVADSQLANPEVGKSMMSFNRSQALKDFLSSDSIENDMFIRVESGSRKERAALKPTPAATELKNNLTNQGAEVADAVFANPEYQQLLEEYRKIVTEVEENVAEAQKEYDQLFEEFTQEQKKFNELRDSVIERIKNSDMERGKREASIIRIRSGEYDDAPELVEPRKALDEKYKQSSEAGNVVTQAKAPLARAEFLKEDMSKIRHNELRSNLEARGVEFGGVSSQQLVDEGKLIFNGPRNINKSNVTNSPAIQRKYQEQFDEILSFIPRNIIESMFSNEKPLKVGVGTTRGNYRPDNNSMVLNVEKRDDGSKSIFDVGLHELWHAAQTNNADIAALEHAWAFDRARGTGYLGSDGTPGADRFPSASSQSNYSSDERFIKFNAPTPVDYTQKTYNKGDVLFNYANSEVLTTLMEGLFSDSKYIGLDYKTGEYDKDAVAFAIGVLLGSSN